MDTARRRWPRARARLCTWASGRETSGMGAASSRWPVARCVRAPLTRESLSALRTPPLPSTPLPSP
eukprot:1126627-Prymnesium_polylepis.1